MDHFIFQIATAASSTARDELGSILSNSDFIPREEVERMFAIIRYLDNVADEAALAMLAQAEAEELK